MYAATEGKYSLLVFQDEDPLNPRKDYDNLGRMVCWHSRYSLGDDHNFDDPEDFLRDLYRRSVNDKAKRLIDFLKSGKARGARLEYNRSTHEWDLMVHCYWRTVVGNSTPQWAVEQSAPKSQLNDGGWFYGEMLDALAIDDLKELIGERDDLAILPLYLYDHSLQSISTCSFCGRAHHAEWDSGQVGYVYADREMIKKEFGAVTPETVEKAEKLLVAETECYDLYMRGECYGFRLYEDGEETDSCWGFLGDLDSMEEEMRGHLPRECWELVDKLDWTDESVRSYLNHLKSA